MLRDTPYWSEYSYHKAEKKKSIGVTANLTIKPMTNTVALSPIRIPSLPATPKQSRPPLAELSPNIKPDILVSDTKSASSNASSISSDSKSEVGKFNRGNSGLYRLRHNLLERARRRREAKAATPVVTKPEIDSGVIDLTQESDDEKENAQDAKSDTANEKYVSDLSLSDHEPNSVVAHPVPWDIVPWKLGPVPDLLYSSRFIDGESMKTYARLKTKVTSILTPKPPAAVPPCPDFNLSEAEQFELDHIIQPKLPKLSLPASRPGTSGLSTLVTNSKSETKPFELSDLDLDSDDDDTPITNLLPSRDRLGASSKRSDRSNPISNTSNVNDPCVRKDGCRKRKYNR